MSTTHNIRVGFNLQERQNNLLGDVAELANIPKSDLLRRCLDYCLTQQHLNQIVPTCSGQMVIR